MRGEKRRKKTDGYSVGQPTINIYAARATGDMRGEKHRRKTDGYSVGQPILSCLGYWSIGDVSESATARAHHDDNCTGGVVHAFPIK